jgi:NodT family efflux transporter outer membrane factor (OMF) lipoprotein
MNFSHPRTSNPWRLMPIQPAGSCKLLRLTSKFDLKEQWLCAGLLSLALLNAGCVVGPKYSKPVADVPTAYKESVAVPPSQAAGTWKPAQPSDQNSRGQWWLIFGDAQLNALEEQVSLSNQNLAQAEAQFRQARALIRLNRSALYPTVTTTPAIGASQASANHSATHTTSITGDFTLPLAVSYEPDLWGRVHSAVEGSVAGAQAAAADLESLRLSLQAELAGDYFLLRMSDSQKSLLDATVAAYEKALDLTTRRYKGGIASKADVALAKTQVNATRAQAIDVGVQRAQLEHAIALLIGKPPASLTLAADRRPLVPPAIPAGLPSELLERRPDIAANERQVAAANAQLGVVKSAYYPVLNLVASMGLESSHITDWFSWPSHFWALGPSLAVTLLDGGKRRAQTEQAQAAYDAAVAAYRQSTLAAFQQVEDNLSALRFLDEEARTQAEATRSAQESLTQAMSRYKGGIATYLEVIATQYALLTSQRAEVSILQSQMVDTVLLIKALGGGWDASQLPSPQDLKAAAQPAPAEAKPTAVMIK